MAYVIIDDPVGGINSTVRCDNNNAARCNYSTVLGGYSNTADKNYGTIVGGFFNLFKIKNNL